jgi:3-hydroxyacyl-CoA dehydrogenase/enoyl-CoA hydratase/3-hydroxybutyryl-CoA epimerase
VFETMVETLGRIGRKGGAGFYDYPAKGRKRLWPDLSRHFPLASHQPDVEEVKTRLIYVQAVEAARCLEDGVLASAADADVGSILGWGFPAYAGGTCSLIDMVGAAPFVAQCDRLAQAHGPRFAPPRLLRDMAAKGARFHADARAAA